MNNMGVLLIAAQEAKNSSDITLSPLNASLNDLIQEAM
ncbi:Uncharacterized protein YR821_2220 [Yersinia ruckeri]|uniref:Uncharacterized protein n=1 Tax=Yersinia ruckeri TaxID=29486 RepID=A0A0A8VE08_YERRU|nr:hypothetical protein yruck0001_10400 [Yersinia ruckeri ATCC 29473]QTD77139.1 Uncharacterized protein YR821_2220 [Yersinia ruckeri]CEK28022.1 hypothetical protein CSF007_11380 [Yersinia ruckeri]